MKTIYKCNHVYKSFGLPGIKEIDDLCPDCKRKRKNLKDYFAFEEQHGLEHFTTGSFQKRYIASEKRFNILIGIDTHWLQEDGLLGYREALYTDIRPHADELIEKTNAIIYSDMDYWYNHRYSTYRDIVNDIEIGGLE